MRLLLLLGATFAWSAAAAPTIQALQRLNDAEMHYAEYLDAQGAAALIESGWITSYGGKDLTQWRRLADEHRASLRSTLSLIEETSLAPREARAVTLMQNAVGDSTTLPVTSSAMCSDADRASTSAALRAALYACFEEHGNRISFQNRTLTRVATFDVLTKLPDPQQRRELFHQFVPLWTAINGGNEARSPYRRMLVLAAEEGRSSIDDAASMLDVSSVELERWLIRALETWREVVKPTPVEPWDYRFVYGAAERMLRLELDADTMLAMSRRYYDDLGAQTREWQVIYDLAPRPGKAPLAYADFVSRGRMKNQWQPTVARVSGSYSQGGLGTLNELVHELGHVAHMMALRTRPAFMDLGDAVFFEAFADVPSWSVYEPAWLRKYLQRDVPRAFAFQALYSNVMLDIAWSLFDLRMLAKPTADPNAVWTDITHRYLNITPHPELAWWCLRVQLVESPGYMVNYGLGAFVTADLRARLNNQLGSFTTGHPQWYRWLTTHLLITGAEHESGQLLRDFLGRNVNPDALLQDLRILGEDSRH